jgi:hypothetical protein
MDELEAVWGPTGRATTDPDSVVHQPAPLPLALPTPLAPRPPASISEFAHAGGGELRNGRGGWWGIGLAAVALVFVLGAVALARSAGGDGGPRITHEADGPPTTIVSAAADQLGRSTTTTTPAYPEPATTTPPDAA